jgi:magnesium transporter
MPKKLLTIVKKHFETDPVAAARNLEALEEEEAADTLSSVPPSLAAQVVLRMNDEAVARIIDKLPAEVFRAVAEKMEARQAATVVLRLPAELRPRLLDALDDKRKREIQDLLTYPEDSAGRAMSTKFLALRSDLKVKEAIQKIRHSVQKGDPASYLYVVDAENKLAGIMNMRDMIVAGPESTLQEAMRKDVFSVNAFEDREKVAHVLSDRRLFALPVVDNDRRLLGVVKADELIGDVQEEGTEDILKMFGAGGDERAFSPVSFSLRKRLPWLYVNLATAFLAAAVVSMFESIIAKITILAVYLPVVAGQGGNAGAQSLAVVMRALVMREIRPHAARRLILKETWVGIINGLVIGLVTGVVAWIWQGNQYLGVVIGLAMIANLAVAGLSGAAIPITMKAIGIDPAQSSSIILTTITDVVGFFSFLGFAVLFQDYLV